MKEHEIRPADLTEEYLRQSAADVAAFFPPGASRLARSCPACGGNDHKKAFVKNSFPFVHCETCATLFATPAPTPEKFFEFYRDSPSQRYFANVFFPAVEATRREKIFKPRAEMIGDLLRRLDISLERVADVGAGAGLMLDELRRVQPGVNYTAVEPHADFAQVCREKGFETFEGFAADAATDPDWATQASLVTSFEVIEHVLDPEAFVRELATLARPGGIVLFTGLCGSGFDILALGENSDAVSPPHHLNFLTRNGVRALLERCGLEEVEFLTPGRLGVDIVRNKLSDMPDAVSDPFLRQVLLESDDETLQAFQLFLAEQKLSSHMMVVARTPR